MDIKLRYFEPREFGGWWDDMSPKLLLLLDDFRDRLGAPVLISPHPSAVGRHLGRRNTSQHNVDRWGEVRAVDVMPQVSRDRRREAVDLAVEVGFTGIGVYPDWKPHWGLHLDVRQDRKRGKPALWSGILVDGSQVYRPIEEGFA